MPVAPVRAIAVLLLAGSVMAPSRVPAPNVTEGRSGAAIVADGVAALGGANAIRGVRSLRLRYVRQTANKGQEEWPGAPMPWLRPADVVEVIDFAHDALYAQNVFARDTSVPFSFVLRGNTGVVRRDTLALGRPGATFAEPAKQRMRLLPPFLMQRLIDAGPTAARAIKGRRLRGRPVDGVEVRLPPDAVQLWFDATRHTLSAVSATVDDPIRGPVERLTEYASWTRVGDVLLPFTTEVSENGIPIQVESVTTAEVNPTGIDAMLQVPEANRISATPDRFTVKELAPGVFRLEHWTHTPMVVVQGDSLVLLEAPVGDAFMRTVLDSLRSHFPDKRARTFVVTHHHWDHTSGVRTAFAAGLRAIVQADNVEFIRSIGRASPAAAKSRAITAVTDSLSVGAGATRFTLYTIPTGHARGLMMAYFPESRLMFEVDLAQGSPNDRQDLYDFVTAHGLAVNQLARIHGPVMAWDAFVKTVPVPR